MARHRKSPRSRRNLMVIDTLTPSQGHQFDCRLNFSVYPGLLLIPVNLICHMTMLRKLSFWPLPKAPGGRDPKNCAGACVFMWVTHTRNLVEFLKKKFFEPPSPPPPPTVPLSPTSGPWTRRLNENPIRYVLYLSFVRRYTKFGLKIFEIDLLIQIQWYLTFWPLLKAPGGGDPKNGAGAYAFHVRNSHTISGWISEKKIFWPPQPPTVPPSPTPRAWPRPPNENPVWYV